MSRIYEMAKQELLRNSKTYRRSALLDNARMV